MSVKNNIKNAILNFENDNFFENSIELFKTLGYKSTRRIDLPTKEDFKNFILQREFNEDKVLYSEWKNAEFLFELRTNELNTDEKSITTDMVDNTAIEAYWFVAIELSGNNYTKKQLSDIAREINKQRPMPVFILFKYADKLTFAIIDRRLNKTDDSKDVLEKIVLIKDIEIHNTHRAHIDILSSIAFENLNVNSFAELHKNWLKALSVSELNKRFYTELSNWFFWTMDTCQLSKDNNHKLSLKEKDVIILRFDLNDNIKKMTLDEIGQKFGVSRERIRQIEERAIKKMRKYAKQLMHKKIKNFEPISDKTVELPPSKIEQPIETQPQIKKDTENLVQDTLKRVEQQVKEHYKNNQNDEDNEIIESLIYDSENCEESIEENVTNHKHHLKDSEIKDKTIFSLERIGISTIEDLENINLKELKIKNDVSPSVIEDLIQFMNTHGINFENKDLTKTGLYNYNLSPNLKSVLYSKGLFYIENLVGINILNVKRTNGVGAGLLDELLDFLISNNIPYSPKNEISSQRLKDTTLSLKAKNVLYDHGIFYLEELLEKNIDEIIVKFKIYPVIAQEIKEFLVSYRIKKAEQQLEKETQKTKTYVNNESQKGFGFSFKSIRHFFTRFEK